MSKFDIDASFVSEGPSRQSIAAYQHAESAPSWSLPARVEMDSDPTSPDAASFAVAAWFLGTKGENVDVFERMIVEAIRDHVYWRRNFHPGDPTFITEETKAHPGYLQALSALKDAHNELLAQLKKSVPFFSMRYQGHMNWDLTLPGMLGYFSTMLYNPNNVAFEGSAATTILEMLVGDDICRMMGYQTDITAQDAGSQSFDDSSENSAAAASILEMWRRIPEADRNQFLEHIAQTTTNATSTAVRAWGHITCDGTVANIEAMWAARNLKFYPVSLRTLLREARNDLASPLRPAIDMTVDLPTGSSKKLTDTSDWEVLNLDADVILDLSAQLTNTFKIPRAVVTAELARQSVQTLGMADFMSRHLPDTPAPVVTVPGTKHYSFPKAAALLGIGSTHLLDVAVDADGRQDLTALRSILENCADEGRPVLAVVAVIGTTEESAVDPLAGILDLRNDLRRDRGLNFSVHADAAWGGYHVSLINEPEDDAGLATPGFVHPNPPPELGLSRYVTEQFKNLRRADSITVDPHKSGYIPYPAGALCYRNSAMRDLVTFSAPVIYRGEAEPTVGIYGVEGSKPGAAPAAVYLTHKVIRPTKAGYGRIIGQALYSCRRLYARLLNMSRPGDPFIVVPVPRLPAERAGENAADIEAQRSFVRERIDRVNNQTIRDDSEAIDLLMELGPDQNILSYAFNLRHPNGDVNDQLEIANKLNKGVYAALSLKPGQDIYSQGMVVSTTDLELATYKEAFFTDYTRRLGVVGSAGDRITVIRSVVMDPWMTETTRGSFIDVLETELRKAVLASVEELRPSRARGY
ncbi:pyridoxal-dependent decarboxylase [Lacipirellula parvula]|uniref:Tyrosine decarboxylase n=1 Tax=Lacipirellula parvula TaxID=2650471 RepID=A0A5K7XHX9_9BACT|nr:pyridoxal-dependent decarboxylase [Lacipirellula parvula]BBO35587.1 tyrosine decarboxylase [Lacipirellula parvula]